MRTANLFIEDGGRKMAWEVLNENILDHLQSSINHFRVFGLPAGRSNACAHAYEERHILKGCGG